MDFKVEALTDAAETIQQGMAEVAAQKTALAEQAKAVRADARRLGIAISNSTYEASEYEAAPHSQTAAKAVERAVAIKEAKKQKAQTIRASAAKKAIRAAAIKANSKTGWRQKGGPDER